MIRYLTIALIVLALCLAPIGLPDESELQQRIFDSMHIPLFVAVVVGALAFRGSASPASLGAIIGVATIGAVAIEVIQPSFGRSASEVDLINGIYGIVIGASWIAFARSTGLRAFVAICGAIAFIGSLRPAYAEYQLTRWRTAKLPYVADFEEDFGLQLWRTTGGARFSISTAFVKSGRRAALVETVPGDWSGVGLNCGNSDWRGYSGLRIELFSEAQEPFILGIRIDDSRTNPGYDERFNFGVPLNPGWNTITIGMDEIARGPKKGRLDMEAIRRMVLFVSPTEPSRRFHVDEIALTPPQK